MHENVDKTGVPVITLETDNASTTSTSGCPAPSWTSPALFLTS